MSLEKIHVPRWNSIILRKCYVQYWITFTVVQWLFWSWMHPRSALAVTWVLVSFTQCLSQWEHEGCVHVCWFLLSPLAAGAWGALAGAAGAGGGAWAGTGVWLVLDARRTSMRQVGQVCCLWNQERRQLWGQKESRTPFILLLNTQLW